VRRSLHILSLLHHSEGAPFSTAQIASAVIDATAKRRVLAILSASSWAIPPASRSRFNCPFADLMQTPAEFPERPFRVDFGRSCVPPKSIPEQFRRRLVRI
jgi:hypothetical protein